MQRAPSEATFWDAPDKPVIPVLTDEDIERKYESRADRIVTETNREKLRNFADSLRRPGYMDPRPFYQRRSRWTPERQSLLIESFLINIPIPPLFVYEIRPDVYEVMDGQQRITAIKAFYSNELKLKGLSRWPELNGRTYSKLPNAIRAGIDRRSISWITVLNESSEDEDEAFLLKQLVFERLNTGGVKLSAQEIRNALYAGSFNNLLVELAKGDLFRVAWDLPTYSAAETTATPEYLEGVAFYAEMEDLEVILRFFALRHAEHYRRGMRGFLDLYMRKARAFNDADIDFLRKLFLTTLRGVVDVLGSRPFVPYDSVKGQWIGRPQKAFADALMVAFSRSLPRVSKLVENRDAVRSAIQKAFSEDADGLLAGRGNTKQDVIGRIDLLTRILATHGQ